jgi:hypothetical protein
MDDSTFLQYPEATASQRDLVVRFRKAFVSQDVQLAKTCFAEKAEFGLHLGGSLDEYIEHEMDEYKVKCAKFGLTEEGPLQVYQLAPDRLYFYFGNTLDPALFEAVWTMNEQGLLLGNQSKFRWEPKMQSIKKGTMVKRTRVCNIKSNQGLVLSWWRLKDREAANPSHTISELEDIMGGTFTSCLYEEPFNDTQSYWATWRIQDTQGGKETQRVWMRGLNHPQSQGDTFPEVDFHGGHVRAHPKTKTIVIVCANFDDGTKTMLKYPEAREWFFDKPIRSICVTDGLSYDWIQERT